MNNKGNRSILIGIIGVLLVCLVTTGCFYNLLDAKKFKEHFEGLGYTISDTEEGKYEADTYYVATKEDQPFKIEYYEFDTEVNAKKAYKTITSEDLSSYLTSTSQNQETSGAVFTKMVSVSDNEYIVTSRVKNTLIFIASTKDNSDEIDKILSEIKY